MKPIRLPVAANDIENTDTKSVGASPKFFSNMFHGGRLRKSSFSGESLGCLSLLDAGEQVERPRAFPSPGESLPTYVKVQAQPSIHIHRPRAVLSSPENDELSCELQGGQGEKSISTSTAPKAVPTPTEDLPHVILSSVEDFTSLAPSNEVPRAIASPLDETSGVQERETSSSEEASSCSTISSQELIKEPLPSNGWSNELVGIKQYRTEARKEKFNGGLPPERRLERNGNEENVASATASNRTVKKHTSSPSSASRGSAKQHLSKTTSKGSSSVRVLRPWY